MKTLLFSSSEHAFQLAWALLRITVGVLFIMHGYPKLVAGTGKWDWLGQQMALVGIDSWPRIWGFLAVVAELLGGILLAIGLFTRISALLLLGTMVIALVYLIKSGQSYDTISHPLKLIFVFLAFAIAGGGRYSIDQWCWR